MKRIVECVPNFSEGQKPEIIEVITMAIASVNGLKVLHVDSGFDTNRTVITFAGAPAAVAQGAFLATKRASELIDMRKQHGTHPRIGATDVLPIVPVSGITLGECAEIARELSKRIYNELKIPVYCYEAAAYKDKWRNLATCRKGEYEGLEQRISDIEEMPDFGGGEYTIETEKSGASIVGARNFLIAVNFNLNSETKTEIATEISGKVRESGVIEKKDGKPLLDNEGRPKRIEGSLKGCKAIGWYIKEYGKAQVSMNITDIDATPLHVAFEEVSRVAEELGTEVTGTEIIGLVPKKVLTDAGFYFAKKKRIECTNNNQAINIAINVMGLNELNPFNPKERIIEEALENGSVNQTVSAFVFGAIAPETFRDLSGVIAPQS